MNQKEKQLLKEICSFKGENLSDELLESATPSVLGQLFFNRMQGIAYGKLKKHNKLKKVNREFRNSLKAGYEQNVEKNRSYTMCIEYLMSILSECTCKFAMLKGAYLCLNYPKGYRTSNDVDLLVMPEDITEIGKALSDAGFKQGYIVNDEFIAATRKEIVESRMMRGETVPYIKEIGFPKMRYLEVDINFSLDYKNSDTDVIKDMLDRARVIKVNGERVMTLDRYDFLIQLCSHLYKEATTLPWVEMKRDMSLYKYCDIYALLEDMKELDINVLFNRANKYNMSEVCAFAILQTAQLFNLTNQYAIECADEILADDAYFLHRVTSPKDDKNYIFAEKDIMERFLSDDRKQLLREVYNEEFKYER